MWKSILVSTMMLAMLLAARPAAANCFKPASGPTDGEESFCGGKDKQGNGCDAACTTRGDCASDYGQHCLGLTPTCINVTGSTKVKNGTYCQVFANNAENTTSTNDCFGACGKGCSLNCGSGGFCAVHDQSVKDNGYFAPVTYPSLIGALAQWGSCWVAKPITTVVQTVKSVGSGIVKWFKKKIHF